MKSSPRVFLVVPLLAAICAFEARGASPEGALALGANFSSNRQSAAAYGRAGLDLHDAITPGLRGLFLLGPGYRAWATSFELRAHTRGSFQLHASAGAGLGEIVQPDPFLTQRTPVGLFWHAGGGFRSVQSDGWYFGFEVAVQHWQDQGALGAGGAVYHPPLGQPLWLVSFGWTRSAAR